jgi:hypothetical protein
MAAAINCRWAWGKKFFDPGLKQFWSPKNFGDQLKAEAHFADDYDSSVASFC